jgi:hypothetical protein
MACPKKGFIGDAHLQDNVSMRCWHKAFILHDLMEITNSQP